MPDQSETAEAVVIIPHRNDLVRLIGCLDALARQDHAGVEVLVVDNGSTGDLTPLRARHPWVRLVVEAKPGAAAARNRGVAESAAPWLFFLDADCRPAADWLMHARRIARGNPRQVTGGAVHTFDETPPPRSGAQAFEAVFAFDQAFYVRKRGFSVTANLIVARQVFDAVGPFKSGVSEDVDWCHRATAAGYALVYAPSLRVGHPTRSDWVALAAKWRRLTREMSALARFRGVRGRAAWTLRALSMPLSIPVHAPRVLRNRLLTGQEQTRALGTLARLRLVRMVWMLAHLLR